MPQYFEKLLVKLVPQLVFKTYLGVKNLNFLYFGKLKGLPNQS